MDQHSELKKAIQENRRLIEENQNILKKIRRSMVISRSLTVLYWVVIAGIAFGAYYFVQPYIEAVQNVYTNVRTGYEDVQHRRDEVQDLGGIDVDEIFSVFGDN